MFHSNPKPKHMAVRNWAPIAATEINKTNSHSKSLQCPSIMYSKHMKDDSHDIARPRKADIKKYIRARKAVETL